MLHQERLRSVRDLCDHAEKEKLLLTPACRAGPETSARRAAGRSKVIGAPEDMFGQQQEDGSGEACRGGGRRLFGEPLPHGREDNGAAGTYTPSLGTDRRIAAFARPAAPNRHPEATTGAALGDVLGLAAAVAVSPHPIIAIILVLATPC
ncbi:hypothetical protein GT045_02970 [Streptomyces sp. SID486]|uniref:hypothetical protein n=1 Tax=Streptomyces sp. SID486 TaxID=2690264 RepID=UPI0013B6F6EB|nr:hypothetical protein [Streptomyces sp. SID486]MYX93798.1 hypothetical protein [Streptomyces sp. SID486]